MSAPSVTLQSVSVSTAVYDANVLEIASSYLEGYYGEYYFFQYSNRDYVLLYDLDNPSINDSGMSCDGCKIVEIKVGYGLPILRDDYSLSGTLVGTEEQVFSGHAVKEVYSDTYKVFTADYSSLVSVNRNDFLCYSSEDGYPHLVEGVQNYAFAAFVLAFFVLAFKLSDRLFRRIY